MWPRRLRNWSRVSSRTERKAPAKEGFQAALDAALRFLTPRPRSEAEVRQRLARDEWSRAYADDVIARLHSLDLLNDAVFARYWVDQRLTYRPRGLRLMVAELRQKGVSGADAVEAVESGNPDPMDDAYRAAFKLAQRTTGLGERAFQKRMAGFLQRRGFDWATIEPTVKRLWAEGINRETASTDIE